MPRLSLSNQESGLLRECCRPPTRRPSTKHLKPALKRPLKKLRTKRGSDEDEDVRTSRKLSSLARFPLKTDLRRSQRLFQLNPSQSSLVDTRRESNDMGGSGEESAKSALDRLSICALRLFGYRWPGEVGTECRWSSAPANSDGIVPITDGSHKAPLGRLISEFLFEWSILLPRAGLKTLSVFRLRVTWSVNSSLATPISRSTSRLAGSDATICQGRRSGVFQLRLQSPSGCRHVESQKPNIVECFAPASRASCGHWKILLN